LSLDKFILKGKGGGVTQWRRARPSLISCFTLAQLLVNTETFAGCCLWLIFLVGGSICYVSLYAVICKVMGWVPCLFLVAGINTGSMLLGSDKILYQNLWLVSVQINGVKELFLLIWLDGF
jgi:hypothetical protein